MNKKENIFINFFWNKRGPEFGEKRRQRFEQSTLFCKIHSLM
jgi:hypothetical protein